MFNQAENLQPQVESVPAKPMNILVLDDSEVDRKLLLRLCADAGMSFEVTEVATIDEMRYALRDNSFDIVFIDYLLPGEDGLDAVELLAEAAAPSTVSILIAGEGRTDIAVEAMRRGCSDYLTKSNLSVDALQKSVATALERRMMNLALGEEREKRQKLEQSVRRYANSCSIEMRTILAGALRRVRKLRSLSLSAEHAVHLGDLEHSIDRLWDALPQFSEQAQIALAEENEVKAVTHQMPETPSEFH